MRVAFVLKPWAQLALVAAVLGLASTARAWDAGRIRVTAGATCLSAEQLAAEVEPLLDDPSLPSDLTFVVEGDALDPRSARLHVVRGGRTVAERSFEPGPDRCAHLHAAVGLAIALAIHAAQEEEREGPKWSVSAAGLWTYRVLPQLAPGAELLARRALGEHALIRGGASAAVAVDEAIGTRGTFDATLLVARLDGCARAVLSQAVRADACAGLLGGVLHASGDGVARPGSDTVPWLAVIAATDLELALSERWALTLGFSVNFLLHGVEVGFADAGGTRAETRALDRVGLALGLGPVYYF